MPAAPRPDLLPEPDSAERELSERLIRRLHEEIDHAGGAIRFDRFMALALYEPGLGYYAAGRRKFGAQGDFVTAPELTPLFGACVAGQLVRWLPGLEPCIWEFGAGSGELAAQLLTELQALGFGEVQYRIVEVSAELRARQRATLAARLPEALGRVTWLEALPDRIDGIVLANELLDALPVRLFAAERGTLFERMVAAAPRTVLAERALADRGHTDPGRTDTGFDDSLQSDPCSQLPGLAMIERPADEAFASQIQARLAQAGWPDASPSARYCSEIGEQATAWVASIAERLGHAVMLLIDYGFPAAELYHPARATGTLNCHYRHRSHADPLWNPGLCDITAHVDFSAVAQAAANAGLACLGYGSQGAFLLGCGLAERFTERFADADPAARARAAQALQVLVSEAEMGELFKVIALASDPRFEPLMLAGRDRRASLAA